MTLSFDQLEALSDELYGIANGMAMSLRHTPHDQWSNEEKDLHKAIVDAAERADDILDDMVPNAE